MPNRTRLPFARSVALFLTLVMAGYVALAARLDIPAVQAQLIKQAAITSPVPSTPITWPAQGQAAIGASGFGVVATHGSQTAVPTASTAKIVTALAVLKVKPLTAGQTTTPTITITESDAALYHEYVAKDGSVVPVNVGEQLSEYQALQALLLPSANNVADTLARWAFGSVEAYAAYANQMVQAMGLTDTHITDASGFSPATVSTAHDLVILGEAAMSHPVLADIVGQSSAVLPIAGTVTNVNALLGVEGIVGIKTGNTDEAGGCYIFASKQIVKGTSLTVIGAVMAAPSLQHAMQGSLALLKSSQNHFVSQTIVKKGDAFASYQSIGQTAIRAVASGDITIVAWDGAPAKTTVDTKAVTAPGKAGQHVGSVSVTAPASNKQLSVPLVLEQALPTPSWSWRLTHVF